MSDALSTFDALGDAWLRWLVERSLVSAVVLLAVGAVVLLLRGRVTAHVPSHLFLLPLVVLVVPLERALPTSFVEPLPAVGGPLFDDVPPPAPAAPLPDDGTAATDPAPPGSTPAGPGAPPPAHRATLGAPAVLLAAWSALLALGIARLVVQQRAGDRLLRRASRPAGEHAVRMLERARRQAGVEAPVALRTSHLLRSPVVSGLRTPTVYLPPDLERRLSVAQLRFVLLHELEHVRRRDVAIEAATRVLCLAWFFHPGVWLARAALVRWREYACDEAALAHTGPAARVPIAEALFTLIADSSDVHRPRGALAPLLSTESFMKTRLTRILDRLPAPRCRLTPTAALGLAATTVLALTIARAQETRGPTPAGDASAPGSDAASPAARDDVGAVLAQATTWLLRAQQADGRWAIAPDPAGKDIRDHNEVHVTGLAVRALLPSFRSGRQKEIAAAVDAADGYLRGQQRDDGCFAADGPLTVAYGHAQALRALCAVERVWPDDGRRQAIEAGVRWAEQARNPYSGWRYAPRDGDNDSKITSLMLLGLHDASELGIAVDPAAVRHGRELLAELTAEDTGRTGFVSRGSVMSRFVNKKAEFPGEFSEEPTAMKLLVDLAHGEEPARSKPMRRALELLVEQPPEWSPTRGSIDYAYWNFGAHAMAAVGGFQAELWRERLHAALIPHRIVDGDAAHWPAIDAWSHPGMEAYATASAMLALQALRLR